jgi:hypothetical protein
MKNTKTIKTTRKNKAGIRQPKWPWYATVAALTLAASVGVSRANVMINLFDTSAEVGYSYQNWNGSPIGTESFSTSQSTIDNPSSNPNSGSLQISVGYGAGQNGGTFISIGGPYDLSTATGFEFDAMIDSGSPLDNNLNAMEIKFGFNSNIKNGTDVYYTPVDDQWIGTGWAPMTLGTWHHFSAAIAPGTLGTNCSQFFLQCMNYSFNNVAYTPIVYIDNVVIDSPSHPGYYNNYVGFTFDDPTTLSSNVVSGVSGGTRGVNCTALGWYGEGCVVTFDATKNSTISNPSITPVPGSGAMHVVAAYDANNVDNGDVIALAFNTNYFGSGNWPDAVSATNVMIDGTHYSAIEFDVLWDTNLSTMSITNFNSMGDIMGLPMGLLQPAAVNGGSGINLNNTEPSIPDAASNGWVHMIIPIPQSTANLNETVGLYFKKYGNGGNGPIGGTAAYWLDNIVFDGGPLEVFRPTMRISEPVPGLNIVNNSGGGYDRESLLTFDSDYSWVDQSAPVTYSMNIAAFPGPLYSGYNARIYLVPNGAALEAEPDWAESSMAMISVALGGNNLANVTIGCKNGSPGANGNLYDSTNPTFNTTNSPVVGNWSFTFTHNTNILVTAPDGESTNWTLPLMTSSQLESAFGAALEVYFGGYNNGTAHNGQRVVFASVGITNGSSALLYDNFLEDTVINYFITDSGPWVQASDGSNPSEYLITPDTTIKYYLDWNLPASGFTVQTNSAVGSSGWAQNQTLTFAQYGDHMHSEVDVTNLPASGNMFFRLAHP